MTSVLQRLFRGPKANKVTKMANWKAKHPKSVKMDMGAGKSVGGPPSEGFRHLGHFATGRQKTLKGCDTAVRSPSNR